MAHSLQTRIQTLEIHYRSIQLWTRWVFIGLIISLICLLQRDQGDQSHQSHWFILKLISYFLSSLLSSWEHNIGNKAGEEKIWVKSSLDWDKCPQYCFWLTIYFESFLLNSISSSNEKIIIQRLNCIVVLSKTKDCLFFILGNLFQEIHQ